MSPATARILIFATVLSALFSICESNNRKCSWIEGAYNYIANSIHPLHVTFILRKLATSEYHLVNCFLKCFNSRASTFVIDANDTTAKDVIFKMPVFIYPRKTNFYIIIYSSEDLLTTDDVHNDIRQFQEIIDLLVDVSPRPVRPRCLLVLFGSKHVPGSTINSMLLYAWSKKFLDFTIILSVEKVTCDFKISSHSPVSQLSYHYYNPLRQEFLSGPLRLDTLLFPNKLKNFFGYRLKVAITNNPPYVYLDRNETGFPLLDHWGSNHRTLRILAKTLNFTYEFPPSSFEFYNEEHNESLFNRMLNDEINLSANHLFIRNVNPHFQHLERSSLTITEDYSALIPINWDKRVTLPRDFFIYFFVSVFMFSTFYALIHLLRFEKKFWSGLRIFELLFNISVTDKPRRWSERYVFLAITLVGFNFTITLISELTEIQFEPYEDLTLNNLTKLGKRGYTPVIMEQFRDIILEDEVTQDKKFKDRLQVLKYPKDCSDRINDGERLICFMPRYMGELLMHDYKIKRIEPKMKLLKPYLWTSWKCMLFERGSPFVEGINSVLMKLRDAGLLDRFVYDVTYYRDSNFKPSVLDTLTKSAISETQLAFQLIFGYCIALIVLVLELMIYKFKSQSINQK